MTLLLRLAVAMILAVTFVMPVTAFAADGPTVKIKTPAVASQATPVELKIKLHDKTDTLTEICTTVTFGGDAVGDLWDRGETFLVLGDTGILAGGFNVGPGARATSTTCVRSDTNAAAAALFAAGKGTFVVTTQDPVSWVRVTGITVTVS
jgi:hypothetical protein